MPLYRDNEKMQIKIGLYSQKVTKLETANFSHPFYRTPLCTIFITFELL